MGSSDENFGPARFFDERLAQSKGRWERLPRPESREPLSGGGSAISGFPTKNADSGRDWNA